MPNEVISEEFNRLKPLLWATPCLSIFSFMRIGILPDVPLFVMIGEVMIAFVSACWAVLRTRIFIAQRAWVSFVLFALGAFLLLMIAIVLNKDIFRVDVAPSRRLFFGLMAVMPLFIVAGFFYYKKTAMQSVDSWIELNVHPQTFAVNWPQNEYSSSRASFLSALTASLFGLVGTISFFVYKNPTTLKELLAPFFALALIPAVGWIYFKLIGYELCVVWCLWTQKKHPPSKFLLKEINKVDAARRAHWLGQYIAQPEFRQAPKSGKKKKNR